MGIVSSVIVINRINGDTRRIRELHTDHLGGEHTINYEAALDVTQVTLDATLADNAIKIEARLAANEVNEWIAEMEAGNDPWHTTPFVNSVPEFATWDQAAQGSLKYWLLIDDRQILLNCKLSVDSTSNNDLTDLLTAIGSTFLRADLRAEIQKAADTQIELDSYSPSVTE